MSIEKLPSGKFRAVGLLAIGSRRIRDAGAELVLNPKDSDCVLLADGDQLVVIG